MESLSVYFIIGIVLDIKNKSLENFNHSLSFNQQNAIIL